MPWRGHYATNCRECGRHVDEVGRLSNRYKCPDCGIGRMEHNARQLNAHSGPWFEHWRQRVAASVGAVLLDDL